MNNQSIKKLTAFSVLIIGLLNLVTWIILIASGKVPDFQGTPISYTLHWISEFSTALLLLLSGIYILKKHPLQQNLLYLSLGCLVMAVGSAFAYYFMNFETTLFIMTASITGLTVILIIINYQKLQDFILMTMGVAGYALLNLLGDSLQAKDISSLILEIPALLFLLILTIGILRKNMTFRHLTGEK